jgi:hypothetical protein
MQTETKEQLYIQKIAYKKKQQPEMQRDEAEER